MVFHRDADRVSHFRARAARPAADAGPPSDLGLLANVNTQVVRNLRAHAVLIPRCAAVGNDVVAYDRYVVVALVEGIVVLDVVDVGIVGGSVVVGWRLRRCP